MRVLLTAAVMIGLASPALAQSNGLGLGGLGALMQSDMQARDALSNMPMSAPREIWTPTTEAGELSRYHQMRRMQSDIDQLKSERR